MLRLMYSYWAVLGIRLVPFVIILSMLTNTPKPPLEANSEERIAALLLLERPQLLHGELGHRAGGAFLLHLLIERAGLVGLAALLVKGRQHELRRALAHGSGGMIGQVLVERDGLGIAVGVVIDTGQRQLGQAGNLLVT